MEGEIRVDGKMDTFLFGPSYLLVHKKVCRRTPFVFWTSSFTIFEGRWVYFDKKGICSSGVLAGDRYLKKKINIKIKQKCNKINN